MFTWRAGVVVVIVALSIAVVVPSLRVYMSQQATLSELQSERDAAQAEVDSLQADVDRWGDDAYVIAQARERLQYVYPGEVAYKVIDPDSVEQHADGSPAAARLPENQEDTAWFDDLWGSVVEAGAVDDAVDRSGSAGGSEAESEQNGSETEGEEVDGEEADDPLTTVDLGG